VLPPTAAGDVAAGAALYAKRCVGCHGDTATRGEAVALGNPGFLADATDSFIRHAIVHGRPGTKMEAFAGVLTDPEIDAVVSFIRTLGNGAPAIQFLPEPTGQEPLVLSPSGQAPRFDLRADPCPTLPGGAPAAPACKPDPRYVSVDQVGKALAAKQRLIIIDARPPSDWRRVHITGAVSIPYYEMKRLDEVPRDGTWVVAYCACPHHLSGIVVDELRKRGHAHSAVIDEGINEWQRRGLPIVAAEGVTRPPAEPSQPQSPFRPMAPSPPPAVSTPPPPGAPSAPGASSPPPPGASSPPPPAVSTPPPPGAPPPPAAPSAPSPTPAASSPSPPAAATPSPR
jgi:rhodanese-related sulfurtransferase/cytochrome c553